MEQSSDSLFELHIDPVSASTLGETAKWTKFLAIVGFVACGFILCFGLFFGAFLGTAMKFSSEPSAIAAFPTTLVSIAYIVIALLYFIPCFYLYRFATRMQTALHNNDQSVLDSSFQSLKSCFKFIGILTIIVIALWVLSFIIGLAAGLTRM